MNAKKIFSLLLLATAINAQTLSKIYYVPGNSNAYGKWGGLCLQGVAGDAISFGEGCYLSINGKYLPFVSDTTLCSVVALSSMVNNQTGLFLYTGVIYKSSWSWESRGIIYVDSLSTMTQDTTGEQQVGMALNAKTILFAPIVSNTNAPVCVDGITIDIDGSGSLYIPDLALDSNQVKYNSIPLSRLSAEVLLAFGSATDISDSLAAIRADMDTLGQVNTVQDDSIAVLRNSTITTTTVSISDSGYSGKKRLATAGEFLPIGAYVFRYSDGTYKKALASSSSSMPVKGICTRTTDSGNTFIMLEDGYWRLDSVTYTTAERLYMSDTWCGATDTIPSTTDYYSQVIGYAESAHIIDFRPSVEVIKLK